MSFADDLAKAVVKVTKPWAQIKKQEMREQREMAAYSRERYRMGRPTRITIKDVAFLVIPAAYQAASGNGRYAASARQVMYAARPAVQEKAGRPLDDDYFTQTLLPEYIRDHPEAAGWDIIYDSRGHLTEPHRLKTIGIGTAEVREYLKGLAGREAEPTGGPGYHYGTVLYLEKEGFMPLLEQAKFPTRYDMAITSSKGIGSTALRDLLAGLSGRVQILVLHDFDKAGFSIVGTLERDTPRYSFEGDTPEIIDIGLRLGDVQKWKLLSEMAFYKGRDPEWNLEENGATAEEIAWMAEGGSHAGGGYYRRRVELNAFTSGDFVKWLEGKLKAAGVEKVIPEDDMLERLYCEKRRVRLEAEAKFEYEKKLAEIKEEVWAEFNEEHEDEMAELEELTEKKQDKVKVRKVKATAPDDLHDRVAADLKKHREDLWTLALDRVEAAEPLPKPDKPKKSKKWARRK
jgi:hypothetical protein